MKKNERLKNKPLNLNIVRLTQEGMPRNFDLDNNSNPLSYTYCAGNNCVTCNKVWNPRWNAYDMICTHWTKDGSTKPSTEGHTI